MTERYRGREIGRRKEGEKEKEMERREGGGWREKGGKEGESNKRREASHGGNTKSTPISALEYHTHCTYVRRYFK